MANNAHHQGGKARGARKLKWRYDEQVGGGVGTNGEEMLEAVRRLGGARLRIRSWSNESSALRWPRCFEIHQTARTLVESDRRAQWMMYGVSKFAAMDSRRRIIKD